MSLPRGPRPRNKKPGVRSHVTDQELLEIASRCFSVSEVLRSIGRSWTGSGHASMKLRLETIGADTSHFGSGPRPRLLGNQGHRFPWSHWLRNGIVIHTAQIKKRLVEDGLLTDVCLECGRGPEWNGKALTLQLHHVDGDRRNNTIENLCVLCPNCHTQTDTFAGRGNRNKRPS
jgi:hypothetical protein